MNDIDFTHKQFNGITVAADWIRDLEASDSRLHKERVIEKALMASKLGSAGAQGFLFNCYLAYNPFYVYNVRQIPETEGLTGRPNPWPIFWGLCENLRTASRCGYCSAIVRKSAKPPFLPLSGRSVLPGDLAGR